MAAVSDLALIVLAAIDASFAQDGYRWRILLHDPLPDPSEGGGTCRGRWDSVPVVGEPLQIHRARNSYVLQVSLRQEWKHTESKQRARYCQITAVGKKQLASDLSRWQRIVEAIGAVIGREPREGEA